MSDQSVLLPKWFTHGGITLAKEQLGHSYTFWTMTILIFSPVANFGQQSLPSIFREEVKPRYVWLTSWELSTNNLAVVSLICGGASDPIRISTRLGNKNANFDRIEKQLLKSRYLRFMPCFCSQRRYFSWVTKIGFEDEFDVTWLKTVPSLVLTWLRSVKLRQ